MNDIIQHWDTQKLGKPYYFFYFYVPKSYQIMKLLVRNQLIFNMAFGILKMVLINSILQISSSKR